MRSSERFLILATFLLSFLPFFLIIALVNTEQVPRGRRDEVFIWFRSEGGKVSGVDLHEFTHQGYSVRGLIATRNISSGSLLVRCPKDLMITPIDKELRNLQFDRQDFALAVRISKEKSLGMNSRWYTYIQSLPLASDYQKFHPFYASTEELLTFQKLPLVESILDTKAALLKFYDRNRDRLGIPYELFYWGFVTQLSRCYGMKLDDERGTEIEVAAMVPVSDMGNTVYPKSGVNTKWGYVKDEAAFELRASRDILQGEEIFESYEVSFPKTNTWLAYMFGFVTPINPNEIEDTMPVTDCPAFLSLSPPKVPSATYNLFLSIAKEHCAKFAK